MSRRVTFCLLVASAALIAAPAAADPECFGESCHLPEVAEPPAAAVPPLEAEEAAASEASAAMPKLTPAKTLPQIVATPPAVAKPPIVVKSPIVATPQVVAVPPLDALREEPQPMARRPLPLAPLPRLADEASAQREPAKLAPRPLKEATPAPLPVTQAPSADYARAVRVSSPDPSYVVGYNAPPVGGVVVVTPGVTNAAGRSAVYLFAPSAKIISIDSDD